MPDCKSKYLPLAKLLSLVTLALLLALSYSQIAFGRHISKDTVRFKRSVAENHPITLTDSVLNAIGIDSLLSKIETVHLTLNRINNILSVGFDTAEIQRNFGEVDSNVDLIDENLTLYKNVLDVKNLQMFEILLSDLQVQIVDWRDQLFKYNKELEEMTGEMASFRRDTVLRALIADSAFRALYLNEIMDLKSKWALAKKSLADNQSGIRRLQATVSSEYFETIDLQNRIRGLFRKISVNSLGQEYDYLWNVKPDVSANDHEKNHLAAKSYQSQRKILQYFFKRNWEEQVWLLIIGLLFLSWIFINFRLLVKYTKEPGNPQKSFTLIQPVSLLATLVVLFNIAPFFNIHPPTAYIGIIEFLLVAALSLLIPRYWSRGLLIYWFIIAALYVVITYLGAIFTPDREFRTLLLCLNIASVVAGVFLFLRIRKNTLVFSTMINVVIVIYLILNIAAICCNLFGRLSLAKIFSVTAIFGLTQVIGLSVFIHIVTEAVQLQTMVYKLKGGIAAKFNFEKIQRLLRRALLVVSAIAWAVVFCVSLNIYNAVFGGLFKFLTKPRKIGDTSFEIISVLLFAGIIYISNLLQQGIGSLYGKEDGKWDPEVKKNSSRLAMTRLLLIIIGFIIAVTASGLPVDKITIVLGALGVGIGLGLQSIVNNLVSGVILIFEQPFRIGDYIELGDQRGRVLNIGIRASKLIMEEGAELIMPNADLLSGRVVNWTLRNDSARIELAISVDHGHSFSEVQQIVASELKNIDYVLKTPPPEILLTGRNEKEMALRVLIWINDVHRSHSFSSELLNAVCAALIKNGMKIV